MKLGYATGSSFPTKWPCNSNAEDNYNKNSNDDKFKPKQVVHFQKFKYERRLPPHMRKKENEVQNFLRKILGGLVIVTSHGG